MRPEILFPLFAPVTSLKGVGPRISRMIEALAGSQVVDLLWHLPSGIIDRSFAPQLSEVPDGALVTVTVVIGEHLKPRNRRQPYKVRCFDDTGVISLVFFRAHGDYLTKTLPKGETRVVSGRAQVFGKELQITHPDHIGTLDELDRLQTVEPIYPLTAGLTQKPLAKAVRQALEHAPTAAQMPEWHDPALMDREGWPLWREALSQVHAPQSEVELSPTTSGRRRLGYDELLANQLALLLVREKMRRKPGRALLGNGALLGTVEAALPYTLTGTQNQALAEILGDIKSPNRMLRLLQGDVGSGKTVVALMAMLQAVEAGAQAALMAPTELLSRQHFAVLQDLCASVPGVRIAALTGRDKGKARAEILAHLEAGDIDILIGTHALFQESVEFHDLALVVVDEQHRFGVHQRLALTDRQGQATDVLVMSATPIPRTLTLTVYGDMDVSRLEEKPPGRSPVTTRAMPLDRLGEVVAGIQRSLDNGARVYWVCPLVSESDVLDVSAAEDRFKALAKIFGDTVGLAHGQMKPAERDKVMADFAAGAITVLVATTVIEVGVDIPEASVMVIEHAERFGLAQLHQLRGRVGRGAAQSSCLLMYAPPLGKAAKARLNILRESDDGFRIAEEDLRLRGAGEILGVRQSGLPQFRLASLSDHEDLLPIARDDARLILQNDPGLKSDRGQALRTLLFLFERDAAVGLIRSG
jgi:ATP-dependent DNA helicase RecG